MWVGGAERTNKSSSEPWFGWEILSSSCGWKLCSEKKPPPPYRAFLPTWYLVHGFPPAGPTKLLVIPRKGRSQSVPAPPAKAFSSNKGKPPSLLYVYRMWYLKINGGLSRHNPSPSCRRGETAAAAAACRGVHGTIRSSETTFLFFLPFRFAAIHYYYGGPYLIGPIYGHIKTYIFNRFY